MRLFIEIDIPNPIKDIIFEKAELVKSLGQSRNLKIKLTKKENLHITMAFIGETPEKDILEIIEKTEKAVEKFSIFECTTSKIALFPEKKPRMIWLCLEEKEMLSKLHCELNHALNIENKNKGFRPHITLARLKGKTNASVLAEVIENITFDPLKFQVRELKLMQSILKKECPEYKMIKSISLKNKSECA